MMKCNPNYSCADGVVGFNVRYLSCLFNFCFCFPRLLSSCPKTSASQKKAQRLLVRRCLYTSQGFHILWCPCLQEWCVRRWTNDRTLVCVCHPSCIGIQTCRLLSPSHPSSNFSSDDKNTPCVCVCPICACVCLCAVSMAEILPTAPLLTSSLCEFISVWVKDLLSPSEEIEPGCWHCDE